MMKLMYMLVGSLLLLLANPPEYQAPKTSGTITYEGMRRIDPSQMRIVIEGRTVAPGSPDAPQLPEVSTFAQKLVFSGNYAREVRDAPAMMIRRFEGTPGQAPINQTRQFSPPFTESRYLDLHQQKIVRVLEVKTDSLTSAYQAEEPFPVAKGWKDTGKTRKIAGYTCQRATSQHKGEEYTIWYTTELPFTYSPIPALTPAKGVVLQVESNNESFKALNIAFAEVPEKEIRPAPAATKVSPQELDKLREKAMADFRQKMFSQPMFDQ
jgi:GLPGLI family protein